MKQNLAIEISGNGDHVEINFKSAKVETPNVRSRITNSMIGSAHWFNTIVAEHSRVGEFLAEHGPEQSAEYVQRWGQRLYDSSRELIEWQNRAKILQ